ncbi:YusW family protein [Alkalihalobacillus sp. LMS39]|uniref:YusW family protein n=1 Tax=Alkalihalobacillus sp. LMS39 TaxID=2924032 RepID=UPI001FB1FB78|nr:YusW family protein [Alkalihalobacillus sp. LMS39]UOE93849.1 YusW family protein [Alkalihalobacillus sp. LMS39]
MKFKLIFSAFLSCFVMLGALGISNVEAAPKVVDFELEVELKNNTEYDIEYEVEGNKIKAKYKVPGSATKYGQEAQSMVETLLKQLNISPDSNKEKLKNQILSILQVNPNDVDEFELEVKFDNGEKLKID